MLLPLMSLPLAFKTTVETIPSSPRYLEAPRAKVEHWAHRLGVKTRPRVGLVWSGSVGHKHDRSRSIPFEVFREVLTVDDIEWVSLQKEVRASDREVFEASGVFDVSKELTDFSDTAALCELMDLVICVDTSVAHLSAALGRPTWIMVAKTPDFRWLLERDDSPWYPTVRLFRQTAHGAWSKTLNLVRQALQFAEFRRS